MLPMEKMLDVMVCDIDGQLSVKSALTSFAEVVKIASAKYCRYRPR